LDFVIEQEYLLLLYLCLYKRVVRNDGGKCINLVIVFEVGSIQRGLWLGGGIRVIGGLAGRIFLLGSGLRFGVLGRKLEIMVGFCIIGVSVLVLCFFVACEASSIYANSSITTLL